MGIRRVSRLPRQARRSKYGAKPQVVDNIRFASQKEHRRYKELQILLRAGGIKNLRLQPRYLLLDGFADRNGIKHRPVFYVADFAYLDRRHDWQEVVEDVKGGFKTEVYKIKKKLFLSKYNPIFIET